MALDHHKEAFDEGTKIKLLLFQEYLKEWLPVFTKRKRIIYKNINIFDLFSGPGHDILGVKGSPVITINSVNRYINDIVDAKLCVNLFFNDESKKKMKQLETTFAEMDINEKPYNVYTSSLDFNKSFEINYHKMLFKNTANLLFLDQNGVKHITEPLFNKIINLPTTDFLFFISSSTFKRFWDHPDVKKYHELPGEKFRSVSSQNVHRLVADHYRGLIPKGKNYYIVPFSIKKSSNMYGLIFGSGNLLGVEKFLSKCWKIDPQRGEANYDIDGDKIDPKRPFLFDRLNTPKKLQLFENNLTERILDGTIQTNIEIYHYTIRNSFLPENETQLFYYFSPNSQKSIIHVTLSMVGVCSKSRIFVPNPA